MKDEETTEQKIADLTEKVNYLSLSLQQIFHIVNNISTLLIEATNLQNKE